MEDYEIGRYRQTSSAKLGEGKKIREAIRVLQAWTTNQEIAEWIKKMAKFEGVKL